MAIALDVASSELWADGGYVLASEGRTLTSEQMVEELVGLCDAYPIVSVEDGMAEDDWEGWAAATAALGRAGPSSWATTCSSPAPSGWPGASTRAWPTRSW